MNVQWNRAARLLVLVLGLALVPMTMPAQTGATNNNGNAPAATSGRNSTGANAAGANGTAAGNNTAAPARTNGVSGNGTLQPAANNAGGNGGGGGWGLWGLVGLFGLFGLARGRRAEATPTRRESSEGPYRKVG